jgi:hypothetical protein
VSPTKGYTGIAVAQLRHHYSRKRVLQALAAVHRSTLSVLTNLRYQNQYNGGDTANSKAAIRILVYARKFSWYLREFVH